ncbi:siphovirus ReqiPepy6 Gp37-like family protein [Bacillus sp. Hm123]|uniref:siphovirus ReqiPepy6 Gp37-like family protein n=1 Tax=Bacillus sp. Hm123 TaxID=3450745 RepID=UPI003F41CB36
MDILVFDQDFKLQGIIDDFEESEFAPQYHKHGHMFLTVQATSHNMALLMDIADNTELRILVKSTDMTRGYIVEVTDYDKQNKTTIDVMATSLSIMTSWRIIEGQQRFTGNIVDVLTGFVVTNAIAPKDNARRLPRLVVGPKQTIPITVDETYINKELDVALWEICKKYDVSFEILLDHHQKQFIFNVYQGADRSFDQNVNPRVTFAEKADNVIATKYTDDMTNYKNTAIVLGEDDRVIKVNGDITGFNRREIYVDAKSIKSTYKNENDVEITLTEAELIALIKEHGATALADYQRIQTFENEINPASQFIYGEHFSMGDKVTSIDTDLGIIKNSRVVGAKEIYRKGTYSISLEFGVSVPTLIDKIKREVKR